MSEQRGRRLVSVRIYEIDDMPPYRFEVDWTTHEGEEFSVEVEGVEDVIAEVRSILEDIPPTGEPAGQA